MNSQPRPEAITERTFRLEMARALPMGMLETIIRPFAVLILIKHYQAGDSMKAFLLAVPSIGLIASLFIVSILKRFEWRATTTSGVLGFAGGVSLLLGAIFHESATWFAAAVSLSIFLWILTVPLQTHIMRSNYPAQRRGKLYSITAIPRGVTAAGCSVVFGWLLDIEIEWFRGLLVVYAIGLIVSGILATLIPDPGPLDDGASSFRAFRWLKHDRPFRDLIYCWMLMGTANLIGIAMWTEYLANPRFGLSMSQSEIFILTVTIPLVVKLTFSYWWGKLFDRLDFHVMRLILNAVFAVAILFVYLGSSIWLIGLGMALQGFAFSGGNIAWALWVTKVAPEGRAADYMSVHTSLTGVRAVFAPAIGYWVIATWPGPTPLTVLAIVCSAAMLLSSLFVVKYAFKGSRERED